jgi:TolB-like protein
MSNESPPDPPKPDQESSGNPSFWQELKRRKVMRVAITYAVAAWLIIQVSATVFPQFDIPMWAIRLVTLLLIIGFPIAVIIAWAFELSPDGIRKTPDADQDLAAAEKDKAIQKKRNRMAYAFGAIIPAFILGVVLTIAIVKFTSRKNPEVEYEKSIAVLPFTNMSATDEHAYFADGVHESILTDLANLRELRVISRTSVMQYRGTTKTMPDIGSELGVAYILEGSMQRSGDQFRLTAQLIDARIDEHLWAQNFTDEIKDIFEVQSELAKAIASALHAVLSPQEEQQLDRPKTASIEAYELYLKVQETKSLEERIKLLDRAVELDPTFTNAWLQMAYSLGFWYMVGTDRAPENERKAKHAIDMAVRMEPDNPDVLVGLGNYHYQCHLNFSRARFYVEKVAERLPQHHDAQKLLGDINRTEGRWAEAISHYTRAQQLEPENNRNFSLVAETYEALREWKKAAKVIEIQLRKQPNGKINRYRMLRNDYYENGLQIEAVRKFREELSVRQMRMYYSLLYLNGNLETFEDEGIVEDWEDENFRGELVGRSFTLNTWQQAIVLKLLGKSEMLNEVLGYIFSEAEIRGRESYEDFRGQMMKGFAYALSGETDKAQSLVDNAVAMRSESDNASDGVELAVERAIAMAWMGKKDEAVSELVRLSKKPNEYTNYYRLKHDLSFYPRRDHPGFLELLNGPALKLPISMK